MLRIDEALSDYAAYHRTPGNKTCHFIGVPLIIFGLLSVLRAVPIFSPEGLPVVSVAEILIVASFVFYLSLEVRLAFLMLFFSVLIHSAVILIGSVWAGGVAFLTGWIFQGIGHMVFEKNSPAFLKNLLHLIVGPLFLINEVFHIRQIEIASAA